MKRWVDCVGLLILSMGAAQATLTLRAWHCLKTVHLAGLCHIQPNTYALMLCVRLPIALVQVAGAFNLLCSLQQPWPWQVLPCHFCDIDNCCVVDYFCIFLLVQSCLVLLFTYEGTVMTSYISTGTDKQ
jgi:hypothetical protein